MLIVFDITTKQKTTFKMFNDVIDNLLILTSHQTKATPNTLINATVNIELETITYCINGLTSTVGPWCDINIYVEIQSITLRIVNHPIKRCFNWEL